MAKKSVPNKAKNTPVRKPAPKAVSNTASMSSLEPTGWRSYAIAVLIITALCYLPTLQNGLVNWDDDPNITENPNLERIGKGANWGETIANIFDLKKGAVIGNYNPLPILTFGIEKAIAGDFNTTLIHFTNLVLHLLTVLLAIRLLFRMGLGVWGATAGGLLFGIHPMRVESVAWATERKDVLFAVFFFAALLYYVRWIKSEDQGKRTRYYVFMLVLALLSLFSKVQAVTLPLSMLALDYFYRRPLNFKLIWEKTPFWLLSLAFGIINLITLKAQGSTVDDQTNFNILDRLCIGAYSFCVYLYKLLLPYPMSPLYPYPKPLPVWVYLAPILFAAIWFGVWRMWKSDRRIWVFGALFFFFNVMFLLQVLGAGQGYLADRFTYVPYFGLFAIAAWYFDQYAKEEKWKSSLQIALGALTVIYAIWTVQQIKVWKNGETLWSHVIKFEGKTNSLPYWNRAQFYRAQKKIDLSLRDYTQAITINPTNPELYNSRGKTYFDLAMAKNPNDPQFKETIQKAIADYSNGIRQPNKKTASHAELLINRGAAYGALENLQAAITDLSEGIQLNPDNKNGYFNRSIAYYNSGQLENALKDYQSYLKFDAYNANVWYECGMLYRALNRLPESLTSLNKAIELNPKFGLAYLERGRSKAQGGDKASAQGDYMQAKQLGVSLTSKDIEMLNGQ
ncbi:MAG: tetratricopeptide repeat protein [Saprospiraceae bacterium]|nr:tetratricopeptide repeat protein [Saprospiraceae bacterium]